MSDGGFGDLAALAGGDESELMVAEIRSDVRAAWSRLREAHPWFFQDPPTESRYTNP